RPAPGKPLIRAHECHLAALIGSEAEQTGVRRCSDSHEPAWPLPTERWADGIGSPCAGAPCHLNTELFARQTATIEGNLLWRPRVPPAAAGLGPSARAAAPRWDAGSPAARLTTAPPHRPGRRGWFLAGHRS